MTSLDWIIAEGRSLSPLLPLHPHLCFPHSLLISLRPYTPQSCPSLNIEHFILIVLELGVVYVFSFAFQISASFLWKSFPRQNIPVNQFSLQIFWKFYHWKSVSLIWFHFGLIGLLRVPHYDTPIMQTICLKWGLITWYLTYQSPSFSEIKKKRWK